MIIYDNWYRYSVITIKTIPRNLPFSTLDISIRKKGRVRYKRRTRIFLPSVNSCDIVCKRTISITVPQNCIIQFETSNWRGKKSSVYFFVNSENLLTTFKICHFAILCFQIFAENSCCVLNKKESSFKTKKTKHTKLCLYPYLYFIYMIIMLYLFRIEKCFCRI